MVIFDWLAREGWMLVSWWLWVTLAGVAVMPVSLWLFRHLPDRGYTFARTFGLLIVGFVFWWLAVTGFLRNTAGSIVLSWLLVLTLALITYFRQAERPDVAAWWRENRNVVIVGESLFVLLFIGWAMVRAAHPVLTGTEKPMELAFMSAIQQSETFPPHDPWMSGYAISYYHFGYIMTASLATLSGLPTPTAFNLMVALLFALTGLNAFGVVYNLVRAHINHADTANRPRHGALWAGVLGMVFVVLMGNFQLPLIELPYQSGTASAAYLEFWDAQDRYEAPSLMLNNEADMLTLGPLRVLHPDRLPFWWWFRASRVINDRHLPVIENGEIVQQPVGANVIDEFPQFSFLLADVHPHVLALPFSVMMLALALNIVLAPRPLSLFSVILYGLTVGGLMFLNMWDGPIYAVVLVGAEGVRRLMGRQSYRLHTPDWVTLGLFGVSLLGLALVLYLPFFVSFRSQASGFIPNVEFPTLFRQYFLMFGPFLVLIVPYVMWDMWCSRRTLNARLGLWAVVGLLAALSLPILAVLVLSAVNLAPSPITTFITRYGTLADVVVLMGAKRISHGMTTVFLLSIIGLVVARLMPHLNDDTDTPPPYMPTQAFVLLVLASAAGLTLVPEFIYLRDNFGVRINTIFKFYYQAWVMFAVVSAYAVYALWHAATHTAARIGMGVALSVVMVMGLSYPILGVHNRTQIESGRASALDPQPLTLDGGPSLATPDDYAALLCFRDLVDKPREIVVAEAIGPAYRHQYGRVGVLTGIPIVLGWEGHENQWRGATYPTIAGSRRPDIETLYNTMFWDEAVTIIERYDIDYIFYGATERYGTGEQARYNPAGEDKFRDRLPAVCQFGESVFYQVTPQSLRMME